MLINRTAEWAVAARLAMFLLVFIATAGASEEVPAERALPLTPGFHQMEFALGEDGPLRCSVWVPKTDGAALPLILALHWGGEVTPFFGMGILRTLAAPAFGDLEAIIVAPDCPGRNWTDPESEKHVLSLLRYAVEMWPVDTGRVAITGYSMGGMGCWFYTSRHPGLFSAAVPVAGRPMTAGGTRVPTYAINGRRDEIIDLEPTRRAIEAMRANGVEAELVVVNGPTHYETGKFVNPLKDAARWLRKLWRPAP